jgi:hypothetical protein
MFFLGGGTDFMIIFNAVLILLIFVSVFYLCYNFLYLFPFFTCHVFQRFLIVFPFVVHFKKLSVTLDHVSSSSGITDELECI